MVFAVFSMAFIVGTVLGQKNAKKGQFSKKDILKKKKILKFFVVNKLEKNQLKVKYSNFMIFWFV